MNPTAAAGGARRRLPTGPSRHSYVSVSDNFKRPCVVVVPTMDVTGVAGAFGLTVPEAAAGVALSVVLSVFIMVTLRHEAGLPFLVSALFVPVVVGSGFTFALVLRLWFSITALQAAGVLGGVMVLLVVAYQGVRLFASEPPPPTARY